MHDNPVNTYTCTQVQQLLILGAERLQYICRNLNIHFQDLVSLFLKGAMFVIVLCTKKKTHKVKVNIATVAPEFNVTMAKTKVSKKGQRTLYSQYFFFFF